MEPFKNIYNPVSLRKMAYFIEKCAKKDFDRKAFEQNVLAELDRLEMKDRVRLIAQVLHENLPSSYKKSIRILIASLARESELSQASTHEQEATTGLNGFLVWPLMQYVEKYGLDDFDTSFAAMHAMTKRFTAEFTIRPFLRADDVDVFARLDKWKKDPCKHVRRLCSEGIRPNLPWGLNVPALQANLARNIRMLEVLKDDPEIYVRRSVANHLKDISAIDQKLMIQTCKKWMASSDSEELQWVIRRASMNLLKNGHPQALRLHGYSPSAKIALADFAISRKTVREGGHFDLVASCSNKSKKEQRLLIEYVIGYRKSNGKLSPKAFRLKDTRLAAGETLNLKKTIHFKKVTTRRHYKGLHNISMQINGVTSPSLDFNLTALL